MLNTENTRKKLVAARELLDDSTTTRAKLAALTSLLMGVHPKTDALLSECNKALSIVGSIEGGDVVHLSAEALPEHTEEEKKRKRALLLFIKNWKELQSEVARIQGELEGQSPSGGEQVSTWGRIFAFSKGPLALVAVVAVGLGALSATSVVITIRNEGCSTLDARSSMPFSIPGLSLPKEPIPAGGSGIAKLPPLAVEVNGETSGALSFRALGLEMSFELSSEVREVTFNGVSLLGTKTQISLSEKKEHELVLRCR